MPDLSHGQIIILVLGLFLILAGLYGLLPILLPARAQPASSGVSLDKDLLQTAVKLAGAKPKTTPKVAKAAKKSQPAVVMQSASPAGPLENGAVEELSAQLYAVRTDLGELSLEVQRLRQSLDAKEPAPAKTAFSVA